MCSLPAVEARPKIRRLIASLTVCMAAACSSSGPGDETEQQETLPPIEVDLPPIPQMDFDRPSSYPDGSLSVWGVNQRREEYLGQRVAVTAYVREVYICENREEQEARDELIRRGELSEEELDAGTDAERCLHPHLYAVDHLNAAEDLLVTGYRAELEPFLMVGQRYRFDGRYTDQARGFNRAGQGLLFIGEITGGNLDQLTEEDLAQ